MKLLDEVGYYKFYFSGDSEWSVIFEWGGESVTVAILYDELFALRFMQMLKDDISNYERSAT